MMNLSIALVMRILISKRSIYDFKSKIRSYLLEDPNKMEENSSDSTFILIFNVQGINNLYVSTRLILNFKT